MKKILLSVFLSGIVMVNFTSQSWAFGSRHHDGHGDGDWSDNGDPSGNNPQNSGGNGSGPNLGNVPPNNFPAAPAPEPVTLSLLGMGLAGAFLQRKMN